MKNDVKFATFIATMDATMVVTMVETIDVMEDIKIEEIFGSVSEFARQVEENGNEFKFGSVQVTHDEDKDIHTFWI